MLKKAKAKVNRIGLKSYKALFSIRVLKVCLPWEPSFADDPNVSVSFERGGKMASTTEQELVRRANQTAESHYDQKLTMIATLFGNEAGDFQEKKGKIIVRQTQSKFFKRPTYRVIGTVTLDLRFIANKTESNVLILPLENSTEGSLMEITISGEVLGENDDLEETTSLNSDSSSGTLSSVLGLNPSNSFNKLSSAFGFPSSSSSSSGSGFGDGEWNMGRDRDVAGDSDVGSRHSSRHSTPGRGLGDDNEGPSESLDGSTRSKASSVISQSSVSDQISDGYEITGNKTGHRDYISTLELKLFRQQRQHEEEVKRLKDQVESIKVSSSQKIDALNREILKLKDTRSLGKKFRDSLTLTSSSPPSSSSSSSKAGGSAIEDVLKNTQEALVAAIASTEKEAASRLQKEVELETTIDELIDTKVRYANVASELDVERVRVMRLRDLLEQYAESLTKMEVKLNNNNFNRNPSTFTASKNNMGSVGRNENDNEDRDRDKNRDRNAFRSYNPSVDDYDSHQDNGVDGRRNNGSNRGKGGRGRDGGWGRLSNSNGGHNGSDEHLRIS